MKKPITFIFIVFARIISRRAYAATLIVGGNNGWSLNVDYSSWTAGQTFTIGDDIVFNYDQTHSVAEVSQDDYDTCSADDPIGSYSSSPTSIVLTTNGTRYFICPSSSHCAQGMRLAVTVISASAPTPATPAPSPPPATPTSAPARPPSSGVPPQPSTSTPSLPPSIGPSPPTSVPSVPPPRSSFPPRTSPSPRPATGPSPPPRSTARSPAPAPSPATQPPTPAGATVAFPGGKNSIMGVLLVMVACWLI